jgi:uncharacterized protein (TIGR02996 family)
MSKKKPAANPRAGFLADILAHPDEDAPRLIFADWLEDHGATESDRARAELIRLQCRMAPLDEFCDERDDLVPREKELLEVYREVWQRELPKWAQRQCCTFRRGFVAVIDTNAESFTHGGAHQLFQVTPLEGVILGYPGGSAETILECSFLERLKELSLPSSLSAADYALLAGAPQLKNLRCLRLDQGSMVNPCEALVLADSPHLTRLTDLEFELDAWDANAVPTMLAAPGILRLTGLKLSFGNHFSTHDARAFADFPHPGQLRKLDLSWVNLSEGILLALVESPLLRRLRVLDLARSHINLSAAAEGLGSAPCSETLYRLDLTDTGLGDAGARALAASRHLTGLRHLNLSSNQIGPEGAEALALSPGWPRLRSLSLNENPIGDRGATALVASPHLEQIRSLDLGKTGLGEKSLNALKGHFGPRVIL